MQCAVWPDPLAAAVYVPTVGGLVLSQQDSALNGTSMEEVAGKLQAFHQLMEDQGALGWGAWAVFAFIIFNISSPGPKA